jgi:hypothetical protein
MKKTPKKMPPIQAAQPELTPPLTLKKLQELRANRQRLQQELQIFNDKMDEQLSMLCDDWVLGANDPTPTVELTELK